jgi:cobalt/nickel transport system permease protein
MHIPDGFVDAKTAISAAALAVTGLGYALRQAKKELPQRRVPMLGLGAAFIFAAQMVNFPVAGGTSGHLVGGALIAALLGAPAAVIVMTSVLIAQCLLFADGGDRWRRWLLPDGARLSQRPLPVPDNWPGRVQSPGRSRSQP